MSFIVLSTLASPILAITRLTWAECAHRKKCMVSAKYQSKLFTYDWVTRSGGLGGCEGDGKCHDTMFTSSSFFQSIKLFVFNVSSISSASFGPRPLSRSDGNLLAVSIRRMMINLCIGFARWQRHKFSPFSASSADCCRACHFKLIFFLMKYSQC